MPKELPRDEVRCTATARSGERCQTPRMPDRDVCFRHSLNDEQAADLAKKAGRTSARVRQTPARVRRLRRRTMKERIASPDAPSRVEVGEADAQDTFWPAWRRVEGRPIGFRSRVGDDGFKVLGHFEAPAEPGGEPTFVSCSTCDKVCALMAAPVPERPATSAADGEDA